MILLEGSISEDVGPLSLNKCGGLLVALNLAVSTSPLANSKEICPYLQARGTPIGRPIPCYGERIDAHVESINKIVKKDYFLSKFFYIELNFPCF